MYPQAANYLLQINAKDENITDNKNLKTTFIKPPKTILLPYLKALVANTLRRVDFHDKQNFNGITIK